MQANQSDKLFDQLKAEGVSPLTLAQAQVGQWYRIASSPSSNRRLLSLGFLPMEAVCVRKKAKLASGILIAQVGNALFGLRSDEAQQIGIDVTAETQYV